MRTAARSSLRAPGDRNRGFRNKSNPEREQSGDARKPARGRAYASESVRLSRDADLRLDTLAIVREFAWSIRPILSTLLCSGIVVAASSVHAEPRAHLGLGVAHAVGAPQSREFGWGGTGALSFELPVTEALGAQAELSSIVLSSGDAGGVGVRPKGTGVTFGGMVGARVRPVPAKPGGFWFDVNIGGLTAATSIVPGFDAHVGWDFRVGKGRFDVGPVVGYTHLFKADGSGLGADAHIPWAGIQLGFGASGKKSAPSEDRDKDGVADADDVCPDVAGIVTSDATTNGCPHQDGDKDGIPDDEDACPDVAGIHTSDPKTNGCPRPDRDKDGVFDDEDACLYVPGIRTTDPKTNGCPPDRDKDTIYDEDDACPDVPGLPTSDPKTNGCPPASGNARVEGDEIVLDQVILFDKDMIRVRHVSWPLVKHVADLLRANPDIKEIYIEGHADQTGADEYNLKLSQARAESVKKLLVHYGTDPDRITTHAYGNKKPRVHGTTAEALHQNRRVEFTITRTGTSNLGGRP
jgi:outer membrane protein OmpA-like peptidoglycan-associated protein